MQRPSVGGIVLVPVDALRVYAYGADVLPAIITRVLSDDMINLAVFVDGNAIPVITKTSVRLYESAEAAEAGADRSDSAELRCYWPPRV